MKITTILIVTIMVAFVLAACASLDTSIRKQKRQSRMIRSIKDEINWLSTQGIINEKKKIENLKVLLASGHIPSERDKHVKWLSRYVNNLEYTSKLKDERAEIFAKVLKTSSCYAHIHDRLTQKLPLHKKDIENLGHEIDQLSPGFTEKLKNIHTWNEQEYGTTLLIKAGFPPSKIATLIGRSKPSVAAIRRRLAKKILNTGNETPEQWDTFILSL